MKCELARNLMSSYIDRDINEIDKLGLEKHLQQCMDCREEYELLLEVVTECSGFEEAELPEDFHEELHARLLEETKTTGKVKSFFDTAKWKKPSTWKIASGLVAAVLVVAVSINGSSLLMGKKTESVADNGMRQDLFTSNSFDTSYTVGAPAAGMEAEKSAVMPQITSVTGTNADEISVTFSEALTDVAAIAPNSTEFTVITTADSSNQVASRSMDGRKVIKSGSMTVKAENLDARVNEIRTIAEESGGYVENSQVYNNTVNTVSSILVEDKYGGRVIKQTTVKSASVVIRVPQASFDSIFNSIKAMGEVENENISGNDITTQYRDTEAAVTNLEVKEKKLQELMTNKATTVDEILRIEFELSNVRTSIDLMRGNLKNWDHLVQLSTIYINLTEVKEEEIQSVNVSNLWERAQKGFVRTINNIRMGLERLFVFIVSALPVIIMIGVPVLIFAIILKRKKNKKNL